MTLILKSNIQFVGKPLGDINGINKTNWHTMLNFADKRYVVAGKATSFSDVVNFARASQAWYIDKGLDVAVPTNKERISDKGLLIEGAENNMLLNSDTPATQNVRLAKGTWYVYRIEGNGTINVTHPNATYSSGAVSAGQIGYILLSDATREAQVSITGDNSYAQLSIVRSFSPLYHKIPTTNQAIGREIDVVSLRPTAISGLSQFTIVMHVNLHEFKRMTGLGAVQPIIDIGFTNNARISVANTLDKSSALGTPPTQRTRLYYNGAEQAFIDTTDRTNSLTLALSVSNNTVTVAKNGVLSGSQNFAGGSVSEINLGRSVSWTGAQASLNGFVSHLAIFDYAMTQDELVQVSKSWA